MSEEENSSLIPVNEGDKSSDDLDDALKERIMKLLPAIFGKKDNAISVPDKTELAPPKKSTALTKPRSSGLIKVMPKEIKIGRELHQIDPQQLMRMVRRVTQDIGSYKSFDGPYAAIVLAALRKARGDMVSLLETHFRITWHINEDGDSIFQYTDAS